MLLREFDYDLPEDLIAKEPISPRDQSRLFVVSRHSGKHDHRHFFHLIDSLQAGDLLVLNNTKVMPARLNARDESGRRFEVLLLKRKSATVPQWQCLAKPGKRISTNPKPLFFEDGTRAEIRRVTERDYEITFPQIRKDHFTDWLAQNGSLPLPPYLKRPAVRADSESYQTVYAKNLGSVAAPTAGLHFTPVLLEAIRAKGVETAEVTLHIGYGTFSPIRTNEIESHDMHEEDYLISRETNQRILAAKERGSRVIAVGTTALRTLESIPYTGLRGSTRLFIRPGFAFQVADGLITNFHLPKSSLYILVAAFLGLERTRECYREAVEKNYRFFSYGDAMAIL